MQKKFQRLCWYEHITMTKVVTFREDIMRNKVKKMSGHLRLERMIYQHGKQPHIEFSDAK